MPYQISPFEFVEGTVGMRISTATAIWVATLMAGSLFAESVRAQPLAADQTATLRTPIQQQAPMKEPIDIPMVDAIRAVRSGPNKGMVVDRDEELSKVQVLVGRWTVRNVVAATAHQPEQSGQSQLLISLPPRAGWLLMGDGEEPRFGDYLGPDPYTGDWVYLHLDTPGTAGMLRSKGGWQDGELILSGTFLEFGLAVPQRLIVSVSSSDAFTMRWEQNIAQEWILTSIATAQREN